MGKDVHAAIEAALVRHGAVEPTGAAALLQELAASKRYMCDLWS